MTVRAPCSRRLWSASWTCQSTWITRCCIASWPTKAFYTSTCRFTYRHSAVRSVPVSCPSSVIWTAVEGSGCRSCSVQTSRLTTSGWNWTEERCPSALDTTPKLDFTDRRLLHHLYCLDCLYHSCSVRTVRTLWLGKSSRTLRNYNGLGTLWNFKNFTFCLTICRRCIARLAASTQ